MALIIITALLLTSGYVLLITAYRTGWRKQKPFVLSPSYEPVTKISIIIPARNESKNIGACITSILAQNYPRELFEIIVVDDHSEDDTIAVVEKYANKNVHCISLASQATTDKKTISYKKAALAAGIGRSKGTLIVTTDADCIAPPSWLMSLAGIYEREHPQMVVAPVIYPFGNSILETFQLIDFMSMQGITAAAYQLKLGNMCNGANLAFSKAAYEGVNGYEGVEHLASGDDYLLMMKINRRFPGGIAYLKSPGAIIRTLPQPDWASFLQQRIRWSSKSGKYDDGRLTLVLLLVYLFNLTFPILIIMGLFNPVFLYTVSTMFIVKTASEYMFLLPVSRFFGNRRVLRYFALLQPLHIAYIVLAGFLGLVGIYKWKGRTVKQ